MGYRAKLTFFYAALLFLLDVTMYVDDTDLLYWGTLPFMEVSELINQVQSSTNDFLFLVKTTDGTLKSSKCFVYFQTYKA